MNPELTRHLAHEAGWRRLLAMPILVSLVLWAVSITQGQLSLMDDVAYFGMGLLLIVWGGRLAADSLLSEIANRTWDSQCMSALGPWQLTTGKLFGATVFVWYSAAVTAVLAIWWADADPARIARLMVTGLFVQAVTLFGSLVIYRMTPGSTRLQTPLAQSVGIMLALPFLLADQIPGWLSQTLAQIPFLKIFAFQMSPLGFLVLLQIAMAIWAVWGVARLLRAELQIPAVPWVWTLFIGFAIALGAGLEPQLIQPERQLIPGLLEPLTRIFLAFLFIVGLTYLAVFFTPKDLIRLRHLWRALIGGRLARAAMLAPAWTISVLVLIVLAVILIGIWLAVALGDPESDAAIVEQTFVAAQIRPPLVLAVLGFVLRDIALIYFLTTGRDAERGHFAALIVLAMLHAVVPILAGNAGTLFGWSGIEDALGPVFRPEQGQNPIWTFLPAWMQAAAMWMLLVRMWRGMIARQEAQS